MAVSRLLLAPLCLLLLLPYIAAARPVHARKTLGCDNRADCDAWGPGLCSNSGVATLCPCMCGTAVPTPTANPTPAPTTPTPAGGSTGCDNRADCASWGPGLCSNSGVATLCPCMCGTAAPTPTANPTPAPTTPVSGGATVAGYWWKTWEGADVPPANTNLGIAFSGWVNPSQALSDSAAIHDRLPGTKYISLGGGNSNGRWSQSALDSITAAINQGAFSGYQGIAYDVEEGDAGLAGAFSASFAAAKARGYQVLVTISHSAPYGISDAGTLMRSFFPNSNIDYLSPQLYSSGTEGSNDYTTSGGVQWSEYGSARARVIPSVVAASYYPAAQSYFQSQGVSTAGYVQWQS